MQNPAQFLAGELHMNSPPGIGISLVLPPREAPGDPAQAMETLQGMQGAASCGCLNWGTESQTHLLTQRCPDEWPGHAADLISTSWGWGAFRSQTQKLDTRVGQSQDLPGPPV